MINEAAQSAARGAVVLPKPPLHDCKIALYGFGSEPVVHRNLIELAANDGLPLTWCAILPTPHYRTMMREVLPAQEILDVFRELPRKPIGGDLAELSGYSGSLVEDLAAQKRSRRKRSGRWRLDRGIDYYRLYKQFLAARGTTHILTSTIETPDAKILVAVAHELKLGVLAPLELRNITGTYFSTDCYETPPVHAAASAESRAQAIEFIHGFRKNPSPARGLPFEAVLRQEDPILPAYRLPLLRRVRRYVRNVLERPDIFDYDQLRAGLMANAPLIRKTIRGLRERRNLAQYDIADVAALPERFVFYPLQYSPESSINTPAPYYLDQVRAIDALRFAMPSDYVLVVKEHPACVEMRAVKFMRRLRNIPGVMVIKASVPSVEVIKRAALTASVTGTAVFEAFLLGRPAIALGPGLSSWAIGRVSSTIDMRDEVRHALNRPASDDFVVEQVAKLMSVRYPFLFNPPHYPGEPMLRLSNMQRFLAGLVDHLCRERRMHERDDVARMTIG